MNSLEFHYSDRGSTGKLGGAAVGTPKFIDFGENRCLAGITGDYSNYLNSLGFVSYEKKDPFVFLTPAADRGAALGGCGESLFATEDIEAL